MTFCEGGKYKDAVGRVWHIDHVVNSPKNDRLLLINEPFNKQRAIAIDNLDGTASILEATGVTTLYAEGWRMTELKPCPFCGADEVNLSVREDENGDSFIYCYVCDSVYHNDNPSQNIIEMWNRRAKE